MFAFIVAAAFALPPQQSDAVIGVTAVHLQSGRRVSVRGGERFPIGSVYKFPIALTVLRCVDAGTLSLRQEVTIEPKDFAPGWSPLRDEARGRPIALTIRELLRHTVSISDNTSSDALLRLVGPRAVTARLAELGIRNIRIDRTEAEIGRDLDAPGGIERYAADPRDTATPDAMAELLVAFWKGRDGLSKESHELLVHWMTDTPTGARRIRAAFPDAVVTHKTGTMPGTANDAGIVTIGDQHVAIAIFTKAAKSELKVVEDDIAAVAKKAVEAVLRRP